MHDLRTIRTQSEDYKKAFQRRGCGHIIDEIIDLDAKNRTLVTKSQQLQTQRKKISKDIGSYMKEGKKQEADNAKSISTDLKNKMDEIEIEQGEIAEKLHDILMSYPNLLDPDVPDGTDENDNKEIRKWGSPKVFSFTPKDHSDIGSKDKQMDFEAAAKISGSRYVFLKNDLALLERALANFMLDTHVKEFGYTEVSPPVMVWDKALLGTGQLPKFKQDLYKTEEDHYLIPTAEVSLTNYVRESILSKEELPLRFTAWTQCFRSEAGSAGKDTKGMIRQHQFSKVELVSIVHPSYSQIEHERMTECAEHILKLLDLPFRTMVLCSGDTGFGAKKTYDIEVWLPAQDTYREISSCSNCGDFQARRMNTRFKDEDGTNKFVNTLNGSGLAVGRTMVAILENYQNEDSSVEVPEVLRPYMNGTDRILI